MLLPRSAPEQDLVVVVLTQRLVVLVLLHPVLLLVVVTFPVVLILIPPAHHGTHRLLLLHWWHLLVRQERPRRLLVERTLRQLRSVHHRRLYRIGLRVLCRRLRQIHFATGVVVAAQQVLDELGVKTRTRVIRSVVVVVVFR